MEYHRDFVYGPDYAKLKAEFDDLLSTERCTHNMEYRWMDLKKKACLDQMQGTFDTRCQNEASLYDWLHQ